MKKLLFSFGTRPEAIKMAPLILEAKAHGLEAIVCLTGQHREMLLPFIKLFDLPQHYNLDLMQKAQSLGDITSKIMLEFPKILEKEKPDCVLVQGDTTSAFSCALATFYQKIPVAHIEAGLRTWNKYSPFPEEMNRKLIGSLADFHFAPTISSLENLKKEGIKENCLVTGNTSIDALRLTLGKIEDSKTDSDLNKKYQKIDFGKKVILVTSHRRENLGKPQEEIFNCLVKLINEREDIEIVYPVHKNPVVVEAAYKILKDHKRIHLLEPLDYIDFIWMIKNSFLILSDSGGVQEEAPYLKKPVLVLRENTERPEGVEAGTSVLVGHSEPEIRSWVLKLLDNQNELEKFTQSKNPYGDGYASEKILSFLAKKI